jgi:hypothetical protein
MGAGWKSSLIHSAQVEESFSRSGPAILHGKPRRNSSPAIAEGGKKGQMYNFLMASG